MTTARNKTTVAAVLSVAITMPDQHGTVTARWLSGAGRCEFGVLVKLGRGAWMRLVAELTYDMIATCAAVLRLHPEMETCGVPATIRD